MSFTASWAASCPHDLSLIFRCILSLSLPCYPSDQINGCAVGRMPWRTGWEDFKWGRLRKSIDFTLCHRHDTCFKRRAMAGNTSHTGELNCDYNITHVTLSSLVPLKAKDGSTGQANLAATWDGTDVVATHLTCPATGKLHAVNYDQVLRKLNSFQPK